MDGGAWKAAVHGVAEGRTQLSDFTFTFHFHALEKKMATHSSVLAWRIPGTGEPGGLQSIGSHRVGHDWGDLAAAAAAALIKALHVCVCMCSVAQLCPTLCNPMTCSPQIQGSNPRLLHLLPWPVDFSPLCYLGSLIKALGISNFELWFIWQRGQCYLPWMVFVRIISNIKGAPGQMRSRRTAQMLVNHEVFPAASLDPQLSHGLRQQGTGTAPRDNHS